MNTLTLSLLTASLLIGSAQAATMGATPGFDRVGYTSDRPVAAQPARQIAPGEDRRSDHVATPERRREMARRLVWLMLSAR